MPQAAAASSASRRTIVLLVISIVALGAVGWGLRWAGPAQHGNFLAFLGSLVLVFPAARQMWSNRPYSRVAQTTPKAEALRQIKVLLANEQVVNYVQFSWLDAGAYLLGAVLLATGFLLQVLGWHLPI